MRATTLLLATLLVLTPTLALAPAAEARNFCVAGVDAWCPGVFCRYNNDTRRWDCIPYDPIQCVQECVPRLLP